MSRIAATFTELQRAGRKALIPYVTAGDPYADATVDILLALAEAGADVIELGVPFSDPMADGPVIQKASERALAKGIGMAQVGALASGYVYYVSLKGVTGAGHLDASAVAEAVPRIRRHVKVPVGVGFGIRDAASAQAVGRVSDGVVIGSRLIQLLENETRDNAPLAARRFIGEIRAALDAL